MLTTTINKATTTQTFEDKVRQYAAFFDGAKKDFESAFDDLYHKDFVGLEWVSLDPLRQAVDKETKKRVDKQRLAAGAKITSVAYTRIGHHKALIRFYLESEGITDESGSGSGSGSSCIILKYLVTIKDTKIIESRQISTSSYDGILEGRDNITMRTIGDGITSKRRLIGAYCVSDCHTIKRGYQHRMAAIFKGRSKTIAE